ncbi:hypothetical protein M758_6G079000 [Ceratodon purpureus]|nr:hypothetical protein M758_6G079000 [Ceratodon purpureus]
MRPQQQITLRNTRVRSLPRTLFQATEQELCNIMAFCATPSIPPTPRSDTLEVIQPHCLIVLSSCRTQTNKIRLEASTSLTESTSRELVCSESLFGGIYGNK